MPPSRDFKEQVTRNGSPTTAYTFFGRNSATNHTRCYITKNTINSMTFSVMLKILSKWKISLRNFHHKSLHKNYLDFIYLDFSTHITTCCQCPRFPNYNRETCEWQTFQHKTKTSLHLDLVTDGNKAQTMTHCRAIDGIYFVITAFHLFHLVTSEKCILTSDSGDSKTF